jgi:chromosome segregation ATPase
MKGRIRELEEASEESRALIAVLKDDKKNLENKTRDLQKNLEGLEEEKLCLGKSFEARGAELAALEQEKKRLEEKMNKNLEEAQKAATKIQYLEMAVAQAEAQAEGARKQCSALENSKEKIKKERDEKSRSLEDLLSTVRKNEGLFNEEVASRKTLEEKLEGERKSHAKSQDHAHRLETTLLALEKKIDELISPRASKP